MRPKKEAGKSSLNSAEVYRGVLPTEAQRIHRCLLCFMFTRLIHRGREEGSLCRVAICVDSKQGQTTTLILRIHQGPVLLFPRDLTYGMLPVCSTHRMQGGGKGESVAIMADLSRWHYSCSQGIKY